MYSMPSGLIELIPSNPPLPEVMPKGKEPRSSDRAVMQNVDTIQVCIEAS